MDFTTLLESRRSIRSFTGEPISPETEAKLLFAANASPIALGKYETVHLTVIRDAALLAQIEENTANTFHVSGRKFLYHAPELILVSTASTDNVGFSNAAIIVEHMALAAANEGVGACHIWAASVALQGNEELIRKLGIPDGFTPACALAVGMTEMTYEKREIPQDRIHINRV